MISDREEVHVRPHGKTSRRSGKRQQRLCEGSGEEHLAKCAGFRVCVVYFRSGLGIRPLNGRSLGFSSKVKAPDFCLFEPQDGIIRAA